jgi:predicted ATPase
MAIAPAPRRTDLLERDHLLARLRAAHDTAAGGRGRLVLVAGEAGVGKTSLVRRFCEELPDTNGVLWGACDALFTPRPLGPIAPALRVPGGRSRPDRAACATGAHDLRARARE